MCIKHCYNKILENGTPEQICRFIDKYCKADEENSCPKICGGCDYLGVLDDRLKELE